EHIRTCFLRYGERIRHLQGSSSDFGCRGSCAFCDGSHSSEDCTTYRSFKQRETRRRKLHLCVHCLEPANKQSCFLQSHRKLCKKCTRYNHHPAMCAVTRTRIASRRIQDPIRSSSEK
ncbi:hypothetical protein PMAYCL1PPCAC_33070, partial [Pristionchus mayeri]